MSDRNSIECESGGDQQKEKKKTISWGSSGARGTCGSRACGSSDIVEAEEEEEEEEEERAAPALMVVWSEEAERVPRAAAINEAATIDDDPRMAAVQARMVGVEAAMTIERLTGDNELNQQCDVMRRDVEAI